MKPPSCEPMRTSTINGEEGLRTSFGEDKSGLGITKRNKKRFEAGRLLMLLGTLAHNLLI